MELDKAYGEINHRFPSFLPDGDHFLYTAVTGAASAAPKPSLIRISSLSSRESTTLVETESAAAYSSGQVFFLRDGTLMRSHSIPSDVTQQGIRFRWLNALAPRAAGMPHSRSRQRAYWSTHMAKVSTAVG